LFKLYCRTLFTKRTGERIFRISGNSVIKLGIVYILDLPVTMKMFNSNDDAVLSVADICRWCRWKKLSSRHLLT